MYSNSSNNVSSDKPVIYDDIETDTSQAGWNSNLELLRDILVTYTFLENDNCIIYIYIYIYIYIIFPFLIIVLYNVKIFIKNIIFFYFLI